jgi:hypothetical protein
MQVAIAQIEAAAKLMWNADTVIKDMTNPGPRGVYQEERSQTDLARLDRKHQQSLEAMVREVSNNLLGKRSAAEESEPVADEAAVWADAASFLSNRIQEPGDTNDECQTRSADMSSLAARHLRGTLARMEACYKLISNRDRVIQDMCNPASTNIDGKALTQPGLQRVDAANRCTAVEMVKSLQAVLLDQEASAPPTLEDAQVWHQAATYLQERIQDEDTGPHYRAADLSRCGSTMMKMALGQLEACCKLMLNHEVVAQDITNSSGGGVYGGSLSQTGLQRLNSCQYATVSTMLREVCARLLGQKRSEPSSPGEAQVWGDAAAFFSKRIQGSAGECYGRSPDMSGSAARALRKVLKGIGTRGKSDASNLEAVRSLMANRDRVCRDISNSGPDNIDGKPLTQTDLVRVNAGHRAIVDVMYSAVCSRLVGKAPMSRPSTIEEVQVWGAAARFLSQRVQGTPEQMEGRKPDMSPGAAQALCAVLGRIAADSTKLVTCGQEAAKLLDGNRTRVIQDILNAGPKNIDGKDLTQTNLQRVSSSNKSIVEAMYREVVSCLGGKAALSTPSAPAEIKVWAAAARYLSGRTQGAPEEMRGRNPDMSVGAAAALRMVLEQITQSEKFTTASIEAAQALMANRENVVMDIANPSDANINGGELTQKSLERVDSSDKPSVNAMFDELCGRLQGKAGAKKPSAQDARVWAVAARYLAKRVQGTPEAMPGRKADMSPGAAQAMCVVLGQIGAEADEIATQNGAIEASQRLQGNRDKVVKDIVNPAPITQRELLRVDSKHEARVNEMITEVCNRLEMKAARKPSAQEAPVWAVAADYLSARIQGSPASCPGRKADMSVHAANALHAVLAQIGQESAVVSAWNGANEAAQLL